ncbi:hypothetical protein CK203_105285 [Vitis vinifera]|uniref:Uncharacterized protein n=1 Tax=Vitis vinifera TaxID=29760 RepID=A0A438CIF8_VITVI|nr:hypothetical protein CK203_105285 [Vitis vinifera]
MKASRPQVKLDSLRFSIKKNTHVDPQKSKLSTFASPSAAGAIGGCLEILENESFDTSGNFWVPR